MPSASTEDTQPLVTVTLSDPQCAHGHRFGINAFASSDNGELFTAGRDGTVRCWDALPTGNAAQPAVVNAEAHRTLEGHSDWVNDLALLQSDVLVSCSSDCTVRLWSLTTEGCQVIGRHEDYVKALAFAPSCGMLASAGFDSRVLLWDVQRFEQGRLSPVAGSDGGHRDSIYALDTNAHGSLLATGSVDTDVRLWDPRDLGNSLRLRGHTDVVRSVKLLPDGRRLISCGSDGTLRIWHIGERRCEQVLTPHDGAAPFTLLPLAADSASLGGGSLVLSADSTGEVRATDLSDPTASATLLCCANAPVLKLHLHASPEGGGGGDDERGADVDDADGDAATHPTRQNRRSGGGNTLLCVATAQSTLQCWTMPPARTPPINGNGNEASVLTATPSVTVPGAAAVRRHATLPSRVQVLTEYDSGECVLWDLPTCACVQRWTPTTVTSPGQAKKTQSSFDELLKRFEEEALAVPGWFSTSARSGALEVSLDPASCFNAEAYAADLGMGQENPDLRLNLGERFLSAAFAPWATTSADPAEALPDFVVEDGALAAVSVSKADATLMRCRADALPAEPPEGTARWLVQCVVNGQFTIRDTPKLSFLLVPHEKSSLPELPAGASRLSAPRALKASRIAAHVERTLSQAGVDLVAAGRSIRLCCGETPLSPDTSLLTARLFYWKQGGDMMLSYFTP